MTTTLRPGRRYRRRARATAFGRFVAMLAKRVPEATALAMGAAVGRLAWWLLPSRRRHTLANLQVAFPEWEDARRRAVGKACMEELGRCLVEWGRMVRLTPDDIRERVEWEGIEHARAALAGGRGIFFATAHYGNWELLPAAFRVAAPDLELVVVGRHFDDPDLQGRLERRRVLGGGELLPQDARSILRALRGGVAVGVLVDLYTPKRRGGVLAPFFGARAWTNAGPATLSVRTGAPILPAHIRRVEGRRHRAVIGPPLEIPDTGDRQEDIRILTERVSTAIEEIIRAHPEPWLWVTRRWKRSPDVPGSGYR